MPTVPAQPAGLHSARSARSCSASSPWPPPAPAARAASAPSAPGCACSRDVDRRLVVELGDVAGHPALGLDQVVGREDGVGPRISAALGGPGVEHDRARLDTAQDVDDGGGFQARSDGGGDEAVEGLVPGPHRVVHGEARRAERPGDQHPPCLPLVELTTRQAGEARFAQAIGEDLRGHRVVSVAAEAQSLHGQAPDVRDPLGRLRGLHGAAGERCGVPVTGQLGAPAAVQLCPVCSASSARATPGSRPGPPSGSAGALGAPPR